MALIVSPKDVRDEMLSALLKELPTGAVKTWGQVEWLCKSSTEPVYIVIINVSGENPILQFKSPQGLVVAPDSICYLKERLALAKFFNWSFLPTFFVFDNYMHVIPFALKLKEAGYGTFTKKV